MSRNDDETDIALSKQSFITMIKFTGFCKNVFLESVVPYFGIFCY